MDGRWKLWLAGGILFSLVGCSRPFTRPTNPADAPVVRSSKDDKLPIKSETLLALAEVRLMAARDPNRPSADRDALLGEARKAYQSVLEREPNNLVATAGLAKVWIECGERERALEVYRRATAVHPQEAGLWYELGVCQGQLQDWEGAIHSFGEASRLAPDNRTYRTWLGLTLARVGRLDESLVWLRKGRNEADARYLLAKIMLQTGREEAGKQQLTLALRVDPNHTQSLEMLSAVSGSGPGTERPEGPGIAVQQTRYDVPTPPANTTPSEPTPKIVSRPAPVAPAVVVDSPRAEPASFNPVPSRPALPPPVLSSGWEK